MAAIGLLLTDRRIEKWERGREEGETGREEGELEFLFLLYMKQLHISYFVFLLFLFSLCLL